ncbi:MAG: DUF1003 domain-containing protein [Eubacteriales bacterium]|nr:DUF1003 domain-containing protein [Eubacteriales bacterium]
MDKLNKKELVRHILEKDDMDFEKQDIADILSKETVTKDINKVHRQSLSVGDRMADKFSNFAGSWTFIIGFGIVMAAWIVANSVLFTFDIYPFILLNLVLSCVAAIQAPVIMMSQNRQEEKDRLQAKNEYRLNIKSELLIEELNKKINQLLYNQEQLRLTIEQMQTKGKQ